MTDTAILKCSVCGAQRKADDITKYSNAPKSRSGAVTYKDIFYCKDKNHSQIQLAKIASRQRP